MELDTFDVGIEEATSLTQKAGDIKPLEEGFYEAVASAVVVRTLEVVGKDPKQVLEIVWQIVDGEEVHYIRGKSLTSLLMNNDKSNFYTMMKGIAKLTGTNDPNIGKKLIALKVVREGKITARNLIGLSCRVSITNETNDKNKTYARIVSYSPSKLDDNTVKAGNIPEGVLNWDGASQFVVADGLKVIPKKSAVVEDAPSVTTNKASRPELKGVSGEPWDE